MKKLIVFALALLVLCASAYLPAAAQGAYLVRIQYDASQNPIYIGYANPGTAESAAGWQIQKITYDVNNNPTEISYPSGSEAFSFKWSLRTTYAYS